jgi:hypothetical protein
MVGARRPLRLLRRDRGHDRIPGQHLFQSQRGVHRRYTRSVGQHQADWDLSFPSAANSGQYRATGASTSSCPRSTSRCMHTAVNPFVLENTTTGVSASHGRPVSRSARPQIHHRPPISVNAYRRPHLPRHLEISREGVHDRLKTTVNSPVDLHATPPPPHHLTTSTHPHCRLPARHTSPRSCSSTCSYLPSSPGRRPRRPSGGPCAKAGSRPSSRIRTPSGRTTCSRSCSPLPAPRCSERSPGPAEQPDLATATPLPV